MSMSGSGTLAWMTAAEAVKAMLEGQISAEEYAESCLAQIEREEGRVQAWAYVDREFALSRARALDEHRREGKPLGPLHGVPVGIKDIIDTDDMPTEDGTVLHAGRQPTDDATVVARLRQAGALILGKTVSTEMATYSPGKTRNPRNPDHTPGGSSSGSAAAVAAGMVPVALGTQTNGSVIRPAAYCGVYGFKPTRGLISRHGILRQSRVLDQVGVFARDLHDIALTTEQLMGFDDNDPATRPRPRPQLVRALAEEPPFAPKLAFVKTPMWDQAEAETQAAFSELADHLGESMEEVPLGASFRGAWDALKVIMEADIASSYRHEYQRGRDQLSRSLREQIERGQRVLAGEYNDAVDSIDGYYNALDGMRLDYDAVVTPATTGTAPRGLESTGSPVFCSLWTLCGMPALSLPLMEGENGLPLGVQLVGFRGADARLLRTARWMQGQVRERAGG